MCVTGNGVTIAFDADSSYFGRVTEMTLPTFSIEEIEDNDLSTTTNFEYCPADLIDHSEGSVTVAWEGEALGDAIGTLGTILITWVGSGATTDASITGTGFVKSYDFGTTSNNARHERTYTFRWDGKTGPTFTAKV